ncbi:MAG: TIGR03067 domain-containing protein [Burkholderiaceae bacterium]
MRGSVWAIGGLVVVIGLAPASAYPADDAAKMLQGAWVAVKAEQDGKPAGDLVGHRLSFTRDRFDIRSRDGKDVYAGTFRTSPGAKPPAIDFDQTEGTLKGKVWKGIYALDGETLTICDNAPDLAKPRPVAFEAKQGSGYVCLTFQRPKS